jgi:hypothetical protein
MAIGKAIIVPQIKQIQLTLSEAEAKALRAVCARVGGIAQTSRRKHFDSIAAALHEAGVPYQGLTEAKDLTIANGGMWFNDEVNSANSSS